MEGHLANLEGDLAEEMKRLDELFMVDKKKLKEISQRFGEELEEGMYWNRNPGQ